MNRNRDIDRVLDTWFVDGPSVAPDRLLQAVFDQVERVPQRRLSRLTLRLSEMNPRIRLITVLAATLVAVAAAAALIGGGSSVPVTASPSPGASADARVPDELLARWLGGPRSLPGIVADAGTAIQFTAGGDLWITQASGDDIPKLRSKATTELPRRLELRTGAQGEGCQPDDVGRYFWSMRPGGKTLFITKDVDTCKARENAYAGTWWREECPDNAGFCLGPLTAGEYATQGFDPFVGPSGTWQPRFGALRYTVPDGWSNTADWQLVVNLAPPDSAEGLGIYLYSDVLVVSEEDQCSGTPDTAVGESAEAIATYLASAPGLISTAPELTTVGGLDAWRLDVSIDPTWTTTCPFSQGQPYRGLFTDRPAADGFEWGLGPDARMRLWLVDLGDGRAMMVDIEGMTGQRYDDFVVDATLVVETFQLTR